MVLLFDGRCLLCSRLVRWLLDHDRTGALRFAPLESDAARRLLEPRGLDARSLETLAVVDGERLLLRSDAVLALAPALRFPWSLLRLLRVVPRPLRDAAYDSIARNRRRWFGVSESCFLPPPGRGAHFL